MARMISFHPLSIVVGAVAVGAVALLSSQTTQPAQTPWPPPKSMVLNLYQEFRPAISIPGGGTYTVLTVPPDRWLTITGASLSEYADPTGALPWARYWAELSASGAIIDKGRATVGWPVDGNYGAVEDGAPEATPVACGGPLGWTFAPGSSVVIRNSYSAAVPLGMYSLIGYYSRN